MPDTALKSTPYSVSGSWEEYTEWAEDNAWGDGLPLIPPTEERILQMLTGTERDPGEVICVVDPLKGEATVEKIAINAVMAGCKSEHMPLLIASVDALGDPRLNIQGIQCSTNPGGPMILVNGPVRSELGLACAADALGPGHPANQTVGRAIRLILRNLGGGRPPVDRATLGAPWKMGMVLGENEEDSPWGPLQTELGFDRLESVVTLFVSESVVNVPAVYREADSILHCLAWAVSWGLNIFYSHGALPIGLSVGHARILAASGLSKSDIRAEIFERAKIPLSRFPAEGNIPMAQWHEVDGKVCVTRSPDDIFIFVVGDGTPSHSVYFGGWAHSHRASRVIGR